MVMPLYDDNPFKLPHRPLVTWGLIATNMIIYFAEVTADSPQAVIRTFGLTPAALIGESSLTDALTPLLTLLSYQFLHADLMHLLGNMIFLWVFGDDIEECLGRLRFLAFYLMVGMVGGLVYAASDAHSLMPLIGASGSISGVVIAYVMLRPCAKITVLTFGIIPMRISAYWGVNVCPRGRTCRYDRCRRPPPVFSAGGCIRTAPRRVAAATETARRRPACRRCGTNRPLRFWRRTPD